MTKIQSARNIYNAECPDNIAGLVKNYIDAVDAHFDKLILSFGLEPEIKKYHIKFIDHGGWYNGSGNIALSNNDPNLNRPVPLCLDGGLVFETIHGFLEPLRHPPHGVTHRLGENRLGESFSTIIEIDFLNNVKALKAANNHKKGKGMAKYHHPLLFALVEVFDKHGIEIFHLLFKHINMFGKQKIIYFDVNQYGYENHSPYDPNYMYRLGQAFIECSGIDVFEILKKYVTT